MNFKFTVALSISLRVLLDYKQEGSPVVAERVLLQPFQLQLTVERNLCPWYTSIPDLRLKCTMGELAVCKKLLTLSFQLLCLFICIVQLCIHPS